MHGEKLGDCSYWVYTQGFSSLALYNPGPFVDLPGEENNNPERTVDDLRYVR
jgi:hypothetical protein